ncbi:MAG TPA: hypothetical protein VND23_09765 [Acidimicrobiales bacterium]|nr:hypothetical protein [Acidimicrobiales bacterium]
MPAQLAAAGAPAVLVTRGTGEAVLPPVTSDGAPGVEALVVHLLERGHRRLAHFAGPPELSTTVARRAALLASTAGRVLDAAGVTVVSCAAYASQSAAPAA